MENIIALLESTGINFDTFWKAALILLVGSFLMSVFGRFVFGKRSVLNNAVSSAIGILFIYAVSVSLRSAGAQFAPLIAPLPFVSISGDTMTLFNFVGAHYTVICSEVLSMIILSFLVNLADGWLPKGKGIFSWLFFRCLTVVVAYLLHLIVVGLFATYLPEGIVTYAPTILLGLLIILLLTGALKIVVGAALTTVNPIIGGLYTFFFATVIGKQVTKAVLTTTILSGIVLALHYVGVGAISIASAALVAYIPIALILVALWFIVYKFF
jgi:hypothetical protein